MAIDKSRAEFMMASTRFLAEQMAELQAATGMSDAELWSGSTELGQLSAEKSIYALTPLMADAAMSVSIPGFPARKPDGALIDKLRIIGFLAWRDYLLLKLNGLD